MRNLQNGLFHVPIAHVCKVGFDEFCKVSSQNRVHFVEEDHRRRTPFLHDFLDVLTLDDKWVVVQQFLCTRAVVQVFIKI